MHQEEEEDIELTLVGLDDDVDIQADNELRDFGAKEVVQYIFEQLETQTFTPVPIQIVSHVFTRVNVPPDGNCFYSAAWIGALFHECPHIDVTVTDRGRLDRAAKRLRMAVARRLLLSQGRRRRLQDAGIDPDSYVNSVVTGAWADEAEILAATKELRRPVLIFERSLHTREIVMAWAGGKEEESFPVVLWRKNEHYDALIPKFFELTTQGDAVEEAQSRFAS